VIGRQLLPEVSHSVAGSLLLGQLTELHLSKVALNGLGDG
jgi:hypothetical protein